jgi:myo-inositol 2-dehydrogenase/D-chiro-inositol 1-dehydrogenase
MRVAFVGTGGVARAHLRVLSGIEGLEIVGHVSRVGERSAVQARSFGGRAFTSVQELLEQMLPDAVWVCVAPDQHGQTESALIEAGVPFFVEKPLSVDLHTAERIHQQLGKSDLAVAVGYKFRALDTLLQTRELLAESPPRMVLATWHDRMPRPLWWRRTRQSGGQVVEQATHLLDLACLLVGEASVVAGFGRRWHRDDAPDADVPDVSSALLRFSTPDGDVPGLLSTTSLLRGPQCVQVQFVCEGRTLTLTDAHLLVETGLETTEYPTSVDPFAVEDAAFVNAIRSGRPETVLCTYADALKAHRLACAVSNAL